MSEVVPSGRDAWRIGIVGAMEVEVEDLVSALARPRRVDLGPADAWTGELAGVAVAVVQSGVGKAAAAATAQALISAIPVYALVNTGVAGALDPTLEVGDVVVSTFATYHDVDATALRVYARCVVPGFPRRFQADKRLIEAFSEVRVAGEGGNVVRGGIASGDQFVNRAEDRARIRNLTSAACCEMEGAAVAQVAYMNELPFVVCRAISDTAQGTSPIAYARFEPVAARAMAARVMAALPALR